MGWIRIGQWRSHLGYMGMELHAGLQPLDASSAPVVRSRNIRRPGPGSPADQTDQITVRTLALMVLGQDGVWVTGGPGFAGCRCHSSFLVSD